MKNTIIAAITAIALISCSANKRVVKHHNVLSNVVKSCKGYAVVVATGHNEGLGTVGHFVYLEDRRGNRFEYTGIDYNLCVGDVLVE